MNNDTLTKSVKSISQFLRCGKLNIDSQIYAFTYEQKVYVCRFKYNKRANSPEDKNTDIADAKLSKPKFPIHSEMPGRLGTTASLEKEVAFSEYGLQDIASWWCNQKSLHPLVIKTVTLIYSASNQ